MIVAGCDWGAWGQPGNDRCTKRRIANPPQAASLPYMPKQNVQISEADCKSAALKTCRTMIVAGCDWGAWGQPGNDRCTKRRIANPPQAASLPYMPKQNVQI